MFSLNLKGKLHFIEKPWVMGILNLTDNSFYAGSRNKNIDEAKRKIEQFIKDGADIIDIGAQSTRPGSEPLSAEAELDKLSPVLNFIKEAFPETIISIDTYHALVAKESVAIYASMVNDISFGTLDEKMLLTVGQLNVPYIGMHMRGTPKTMQNFTTYNNLMEEIVDFFIQRVALCRAAGIKDVVIDPGFGFAKNPKQNFLMLKKLSDFQILQTPILVGLSRKSTIYKTLGTTADEALNGTTVLHTLALHNGANILRVHDVKEAREAITLLEAYRNA